MPEQHPRRRTFGAVLVPALLALTAVATLSPMAPGLATAAVECGTYRSETVPPPTIRVFRTATGTVDVVDFRTYVKNVLSREWISSWTTESLRSGAIAVKNYGWYQVLHWRGYVNEDGECFDVFDSTRDQHYDPSRPTYATAAAAVDSTWGTLAHRGGRIFATYYNAGAPNEPCGANANGWRMYQWGTQTCGLAGRTAAQILATYYSGVVVIAPPPASPPSSTPSPIPTPKPTPAPTPRPTATPTPTPRPSPAPTASGAPGPRPTPAPSAVPTPVPTATPMPTAAPPASPRPVPAPPAEMPGGGQVGITQPPPPPPRNPVPIVVTASGDIVETPEPSHRQLSPTWERPNRVAGFEAAHDGRRVAESRQPRVAARAIGPARVTLATLLTVTLGTRDTAAAGYRADSSRAAMSSAAATSWIASPTDLNTVIASGSRR